MANVSRGSKGDSKNHIDLPKKSASHRRKSTEEMARLANAKVRIAERHDTVTINARFLKRHAINGIRTFVAPIRGAFSALRTVTGPLLSDDNDRPRRKAKV